jgi:hypothetical protein
LRQTFLNYEKLLLKSKIPFKVSKFCRLKKYATLYVHWCSFFTSVAVVTAVVAVVTAVVAVVSGQKGHTHYH